MNGHDHEAYTNLQNENTRLRSEVANQAEEIKNRGGGIESLVHTMGILKKHLEATEGESVQHLISRLEGKTEQVYIKISNNEWNKILGENTRLKEENNLLKANLASTNSYLPFWVSEAPLNPGPRGSRYAVFDHEETWFIRDGEDREEVLGLCHQICAMLNRAWSMARGKP